jgi:UDP-N-acetylglucosamine--N-acetylmuramyl-(pentapeptide) pyrophosphoryl-undecaprenol N-acetylglucosamine transferase
MNSVSIKRILIAAGGTGGDLFPAIAIIEELQKRNPTLQSIFTGSPDRIEASIIPSKGYEFRPMNSLKGFRGLSSSLFSIPFILLYAYRELLSIIKDFPPSCIICGGNYISFPAGLLARFHHIPLIIIEPNAKPGRTNLFLSRFATFIITAFEETASFFPQKVQRTIHHLGNPLRASFLEIKPTKEKAAEMYGFNPEMKTILIFGGSLGARSINHAVVKHIDYFEKNSIQVLWQTGTSFSVPVDLPPHIHTLPFIDDMISAYAASDLVICRSGGGTVAELAVCGKPSILIPLPGAANNEQEENAHLMEIHGAALLVHDNALETELEYIINRCINNPELLETMSNNATLMSKPLATSKTADLIETLL